MNRPRLFLSAVSEELRTARQSVATTVRTLGYDPVSQDDFPTGYGELRQWLREQLNSCEGLIQLVGHGYGTEPPDLDPDYGRVSYTHFEFLYARDQGKKTWVIVIGEQCRRDTPSDRLDLPREPTHPNPSGYQAERRTFQEQYIARLKQDNHLRHLADSDTELDNIVLRLRDELRTLREHAERKQQRLTIGMVAILAGLVVLGGGGWLGYQQLSREVRQVGVVNAEKIHAHLLQTAEETHHRELKEAESESNWKRRQQLHEVANNAHRVRLARIEDLAASFAEIETRGTSTNVFQEMTRILSEQGVDEAIAYVETQQTVILQTVRARILASRERNRADLEPLLRAAALQQAKGRPAEARELYANIFSVEPDWPEALHAAFWFHADQGDLARIRTTLTDSRREYEQAWRTAQHLTDTDPTNSEWQRDLSVSYSKLGNVAQAQGKLGDAAQAYRDDLAIAKRLTAADPSNSQWQRDLAVSYETLGNVAQAQGKLDDAAQAYHDSLAIRKRLTAADPSNTQWQRDLAVSYDNLGNVAEQRSDTREARTYRKLAVDTLLGMTKRGLHLSPEDRERLERLQQATMTGGG